MEWNIRKLYKPIQPSIQQRADHVVYREILPSLELQPFIYCYWELKTTQVLAAPFCYRVVADGCMDVFFELDAPQNSFVMGFCREYTQFQLGSTFHYVGIRFLPTMFPQIFKIDASELSNRFLKLQNIYPELSNFIGDSFDESQNLESITDLLDRYFLQLIAKCVFNMDNRMYEAIDIILKNSGVVNVEQDLQTGISPRQLRRLFKYYIGDTAKTFSKVVQFQQILNAKPSVQSLKQNKLFYDVGYYDQAHFIKDFKNFYGVTPTEAFRR